MAKFKFDPKKHHRHSIRLQGYDYSSEGGYFITICTKERQCIFGRIKNGEIKLNDTGKMIQTVWDNLPKRFSNLELDQFVIMPNHIHGIIMLMSRNIPYGRTLCSPSPARTTSMQTKSVGAQPCVRPILASHVRPILASHVRPFPTPPLLGEHKVAPLRRMGDHKDRPYGTLVDTIGRVVQAFKSISTHQYILGIKKYAWPPFPGHLWQRNYYEHVIRNEKDLNQIREYILNNPLQWSLDENNPDYIKKIPHKNP